MFVNENSEALAARGDEFANALQIAVLRVRIVLGISSPLSESSAARVSRIPGCVHPIRFGALCEFSERARERNVREIGD